MLSHLVFVLIVLQGTTEIQFGWYKWSWQYEELGKIMKLPSVYACGLCHVISVRTLQDLW